MLKREYTNTAGKNRTFNTAGLIQSTTGINTERCIEIHNTAGIIQKTARRNGILQGTYIIMQGEYQILQVEYTML